MKAKISIIVPVYKVEKFIDQCITSLTNQTLKDIEIILIDDGSPDKCGKICDDYAKKDKRIKVIHKENNGVSSARNDGIKASTGKYLMFVDSDDWAEPNMCEVAYNTIEEKQVDIAIFTAYRNYPNFEEEVHAPSKLLIKTKKDLNKLQASTIYFGYFDQLQQNARYDCMPAPWSKIYKSELIKNNNIMFNTNVKGIFDDGLFVVETIEHAKKVYIDKIPLYHFRYITTSLTHNYKANVLNIYDLVFQELENFKEKYQKDELYEESYAARVNVFLIKSLHLYFFNNQNPKPLKVRLKELKQTLQKYSKAIQEVNLDYFPKKRQIVIKLFKLQAPFLIYLFESINNFRKKIKERK